MTPKHCLDKLKEFSQYVEKFVKQNEEGVEEIHKLRVMSRELYSLLGVEEPFNKSVKKVIKISNKIRDIDVFFEVYFNALPKKYRTQLDAGDVIQSTNKSRKKEIKKLHTYLQNLVLPKSAEFHDEGEEIGVVMSGEGLKLEKAESHKYRIYIKKILFREKNSSVRDEQKIKILSKIKDTLGTINDNFNGVQRLNTLDIKTKLLKKIENFTQKQNLKLFKRFQKLNQKYQRNNL